jgi:hypothetical protein
LTLGSPQWPLGVVQSHLGVAETLLGIMQTHLGAMQTMLGVAQSLLAAAQLRLGFAQLFAKHFPQRDRQNDDAVQEIELGLLQRLFRRARDRQSRGHARRAETAASPADPVANHEHQAGFSSDIEAHVSRYLFTATLINTCLGLAVGTTVDVDPVHCESRGRMRKGVCSTFLAERADKGYNDQLLPPVTPAATPAKEKTR